MRLAREGELPVAEAVAHPPRGGRRAGLRAPARRRAPRHQAGQHAAVRRARGGHRLRRRQGGRARQRPATSLADLARRGARHAGVHGAGAGRGRSARGPPGRHLRASACSRTRCSAAAAVHRATPQAMLAAHITQTPEPIARLRRLSRPPSRRRHALPREARRPTAGRPPPSWRRSSMRRPRRAADMRRPARSRRSRPAPGGDPPRASGRGWRCSSRRRSAVVLARVVPGVPARPARLGAVGRGRCCSLIGLPIMLVTGAARAPARASRGPRRHHAKEQGLAPLVHLAAGAARRRAGVRGRWRRRRPPTRRCACSGSARWERWSPPACSTERDAILRATSRTAPPTPRWVVAHRGLPGGSVAVADTAAGGRAKPSATRCAGCSGPAASRSPERWPARSRSARASRRSSPARSTRWAAATCSPPICSRAADGSVLTAVRETAADQAALLAAIDRLSKQAARADRRIAGHDPRQPAARAGDHRRRWRRSASTPRRSASKRTDRGEEAVPLLEEAVALDSGFAMAYRKLAVVLGKPGGSPRRASRGGDAGVPAPRPAAARGAGARHRVLLRLRGRRPGKVMAAYRSVLAADPDNVDRPQQPCDRAEQISGATPKPRRWPSGPRGWGGASRFF